MAAQKAPERPVKMPRTRALNELRGLCGRVVTVAVGPPFGAVILRGRLHADPDDRSRFFLGLPETASKVRFETASVTVPSGRCTAGWHQGFLMLMFGELTIGVRVEGEAG